MSEKIIEKLKAISKKFPEVEEELGEICEEIKDFSFRLEEIESWKDKLEGRLRAFGLMRENPEYRGHITTLLTNKDIILGYDQTLESDYSAVAITETLWDAEAIENTEKIADVKGLAILSRHLSRDQFNKLLRLKKDTNFFVAFAADAHEDAIKIVKTLHNEGRNAYIVLLKKGSPACVSKEELIEAFGIAEPYSFNLEMRIKLR